MKEAFVRAVMNDTPSVDYDEAIRVEATKWLKAHVPLDVQKLAAKHPDYFDTDEYISVGEFGTVSFPVLPKGGRFYNDHPRKKMERELAEALKDLLVKYKAQKEQRRTLEHKLNGTIEAFNTVKQAKDALPELAKYLPEDEAKAAKTLPAIANTIADLVAAGWPNGKAAA